MAVPREEPTRPSNVGTPEGDKEGGNKGPVIQDRATLQEPIRIPEDEKGKKENLEKPLESTSVEEPQKQIQPTGREGPGVGLGTSQPTPDSKDVEKNSAQGMKK